VIGIAVLGISAGLVAWASIVEPGFRYAAGFILTLITGALLLMEVLHQQ